MDLAHIIQVARGDAPADLALRNGKLINEATILREGDEIRLLAVISGG